MGYGMNIRGTAKASAMRVGLLLLATLAVRQASAAGCSDAQFVDTIAESAWINIDVSPAQSTAGVREALRLAQSSYPTRPVRIQLAPGRYADNLGAEIFAQRMQRGAANPIWLRATDSRPNATVLDHGINLLGVSYIAIEGLTIGPETVGAWNGQTHANPQPLQAAAGIHVAGAALDARTNANRNGAIDYTVYGRYEPSHHILVRRVTVQNLFERTEPDAETSESQGMDGMKFNQVQDLWVLDSAVRQTTRHGIDNVGVHRAAFCRNLVAQTGGGLGIEAKGGSVDVLYDSNTFYRVRRVELGGEETDATYYFSLDGRYDYEALRTVARNNLIVDAREAALEFSGCQDCVAVGNSIVFTTAYQAPSSGGTTYGGDAIRVHDSRLLGAVDGAGSDCQYWDSAAQDYVTVDPCWGVGAQSPAPANKLLAGARLTIVNNLFSAEGGSLGSGLGGVLPCPLNVINGGAVLSLNANFWWNGGKPLPINGCSTLNEGKASKLPGAGATASPIIGGAVDHSSLQRMGSSIISALLPKFGSPLVGMAVVQTQQSGEDRLGAPRVNNLVVGATDTVGALLGTNAASDRLFNFAERIYPQLFASHTVSATDSGYYYRYDPRTRNYIGTANGRVYVLGPSFNNQLVDLGLMTTWLPLALDAGL